MDPGDRDLLVTGPHATCDVGDHLLKGSAAGAAAGARNDAVAALFIAAGLHTKREGCSPCCTGGERAATRAIAVTEPLGRRQLTFLDERGDESLLVIVAQHPKYVRQRCDFFRTSCGVAAGNHDARVRIVAHDAPNGLARALVGRRGY